jgi:hypothetical protein
MVLHSIDAMNDLYDRLRADPWELEKIENRWRPRIGRGGLFTLPPGAVVAIPERETLRANFAERYGIKRVDEFYIPVVLDRATYRRVSGMPEPGIGDWLASVKGDADANRLLSASRGHISSTDDWIIGYISTSIPTDLAIEHEGIHAAMFTLNPFYRKKSFLGSMEQSGLFVDGWVEAVPYVATEEGVDAENIYQRYVGNALNRSGAQRIGGAVSLLALAPLFAAQTRYDGMSGSRTSRVRLDRTIHYAYHGLRQFGVLAHRPSKVKDRWLRAFAFAQQLKEKHGADGLVQLACAFTEPELRRRA